MISVLGPYGGARNRLVEFRDAGKRHPMWKGYVEGFQKGFDSGREKGQKKVVARLCRFFGRRVC